MAIAVGSISMYVYKYIIHRIALSYTARGAISAKSVRNIIVCCVDLPCICICIVFILYYCTFGRHAQTKGAYSSLLCFI